MIGTGYGSDVHIPAFLKTEGYSITGICDSGTGSAKKVKERFNLNCDIYKNAMDLIASKNTDLVDIVSPPSTHSNFLKEALKHEKNVICEKPCGLSFNEVKDIDFENKNLICVIGYQYRFERLMRILKHHCDSNFLGEINRIDVNWHFKIKKKKCWKQNNNNGGGIVDDVLCHVIDYLLLFFGRKILNPQRLNFEGFIKNQNCNIIFTYNDSILSKVIIDRDSTFFPSQQILINGKKKNAELIYYSPFNYFSKKLEIFKNQKLIKIYTPNINNTFNLSDDRIESFSHLLKKFIKKKKRYKLCCLEDGKKIRMILDEINKKLK